jgi:hypothetical protein
MAKRKNIDVYKFTVYNTEWTAKLHTPKTFIKKYSDCGAITLLSLREVHFRTDHLAIEFIRHELNHIFLEMCNVDSAEITLHQLEEIMCTINSRETHVINKIAEDIQTFFLMRHLE